jgi:predicted protein tyrosine phosphatase
MELKNITMDKFTANFSRVTIETRFPFQLNHRDWLISINDAAGWAPSVKDNFDQVFEFYFDDEADPTWPGIMQQDQAIQLANVISNARDMHKNLWVHCTAGMCRSGAVVEVLGLLGWTITDEFSPRRIPNTHVFRLLRQQFPEISQSWDDEIAKKGYDSYNGWINHIDD